MGEVESMSTVTMYGTRLEQLHNLAKILALQIDQCVGEEDGPKLLPQLSRQYRETIREIEEIEGVNNDDELGKLLSDREADGKSGTVR